MVKLALIRHGTTNWNRKALVQGSTDIPLDNLGVEEVSSWVLPRAIKSFSWISSPLKRAKKTAQILSGEMPEIDYRLSEMSWGDWEGCKLSDLREELGDLMVAWEARGLDFKGPNGESPREVQKRLLPFLLEIANGRRDCAVVCHKGVIRAIYALATNWMMTDKPRDKLKNGHAHIFELDQKGHPSISELNIDMTQ